MKANARFLPLLMLLCLLWGCLAAPGMAAAGGETVYTDPALDIRLDMTSSTLKQEVTVYAFVDGDTTHFNVPQDVMPDGVFRARYLAINTPESTGKIEEYGKAASAFTREKLSAAESIIIESDSDRWDADSTGGRHLVWVWYKTPDMTDYRNLNVEILLNGMAVPNSSANNRYGATCTRAIDLAKENKRGVYSGQPDPDFYYGEAVELTLKELRLNVQSYEGMKVAFDGVITMNDGGSVYVEDYDPETGRYYGISVYYGYGLSGKGLDILMVGNRSRIVGTVQYYEAGESWQISGLTYRRMKPKDPDNIQLISQGHEPAWTLTEPGDFAGKVTIQQESGSAEYDYAALAMDTTVAMEELTIASAGYSAENAALTFLCQKDGAQVQVYVENVLKEALPEVPFTGRMLDVKGIVDCFDGVYQIRVLIPQNVDLYP